MDNALEHFDPASEAFALVAQSLEAAGVSLAPSGAGSIADTDEPVQS